MRQTQLPEDDKEARCNEKYWREKVHDAKGTLGPSDENGVGGGARVQGLINGKFREVLGLRTSAEALSGVHSSQSGALIA